MCSIRRGSFAKISKAVAIDVETTGLSPTRDRIVAVAAIQLDFDHLLAHGASEFPNFYGLFDPQRSIPAAASSIHGITNADIDGEGTFSDEARSLLDFIEDMPLVAHNCEFDASFLSNEFKRAGFSSAMKRPLYCTMQRACHYVSKGRTKRYRISLKDACFEFKVPFYDNSLHDAMEDALATAKLAGTLVALDREASRSGGIWNWNNY